MAEQPDTTLSEKEQEKLYEHMADTGKRGGKRDGTSETRARLHGAGMLITLDTTEVFRYCGDLTRVAGVLRQKRADLDRFPYFSAYSVPNGQLIVTAKNQLDRSVDMLQRNIGATLMHLFMYREIEARYPGVGLRQDQIDAIFSKARDANEDHGIDLFMSRFGGFTSGVGAAERTYRALEAMDRLRDVMALEKVNDALAGTSGWADGLAKKRLKALYGATLTDKQAVSVIKAYRQILEDGGQGFSDVAQVTDAMVDPYRGNPAALARHDPFVQEQRLLALAEAEVRTARAATLVRLYDRAGIPRLSSVASTVSGSRAMQTIAEINGMRRVASSGRFLVRRVLGPIGAGLDAWAVVNPDSDTLTRVSGGLGLASLAAPAAIGLGAELAGGSAAAAATGIGVPVAAVLAVAAAGVAAYSYFDARHDASEAKAYQKAYAKAAEKVQAEETDEILQEEILESIRSKAEAANPVPIRPITSPWGLSIFTTPAEAAS